jgi:hypothetical protein
MAVIVDLERYRVETHEAPHLADLRPKLLLGTVRIVRKSDGAFIDLDQTTDFAFYVLFETLHGTPAHETGHWVQEYIDDLNTNWDCDGELWQKPEAMIVTQWLQ